MQSVEPIDGLLKNEIAATATYRQLLDQFQDDGGFNETVLLTPVYEGHKNAVSDLQIHIRKLGGTPPPAEHTETWKVWGETIHGGANKPNKQAALDILRQGEKRGAAEYLKVLGDAQLPLSIRCLIEWKLLLIQISHIRILERLLG